MGKWPVAATVTSLAAVTAFSSTTGRDRRGAGGLLFSYTGSGAADPIQGFEFPGRS